MRSLGQPRVLKAAVVAALLTSLVCLPRLLLATNLHYPSWYLATGLFLGSTVLWAFVFAWHTLYTHRPVFTLKPGPRVFILATIAGTAGAIALHFLLDPALRARTPEDYPGTLQQWVAMTLFSLAFTQLFLVFAPFAWLVRLFRRPEPAMFLTAAFGVFVLALKNRSASSPMPGALLLGLLVFRIIGGLLSVYFFLQGGVVLVWWWGLLLQSRHLITCLSHDPGA